MKELQLRQSIQTRRVKERDLIRLAEMVNSLAAHHGDPESATPETLAGDVLGPDPWIQVFVAENAAGLVGYAALLRLAQMQFGVRGIELHHLFIAPGHRGNGIGQLLIQATIEFGHQAGCAWIVVGTHPANTAAQAFYPACGFKLNPVQGPRFLLNLGDSAT